MWPDGWTAVTADGKRSAQFEHTLLVSPFMFFSESYYNILAIFFILSCCVKHGLDELKGDNKLEKLIEILNFGWSFQ